MGKIYIIPEQKEIKQSIELLEKYDGAFEYNDFWVPQILADKKKQMEIIDFYSRYRSDFSSDTLHGAFLDVTIHSTDPMIREVSMLRIQQSMEIAKEMGVRGVVFHTNLLQGFHDSAYLLNWAETNETFFRKMLSKFPDQEIYMENMFDDEPDMLLDMVNRLKDEPKFGICLDYAHASIFGKDIHEWVRQLSRHVRHMHINDNDLKNDLHLAIGSGETDWETYKELMQEYQLQATVLVETKGVKSQGEALEYMKKQGIYPLKKEYI